MMDHLEIAFQENTRIRIPDELLPIEGIDTLAHEFDEDGVVYEKDGVVVTAFAVEHGDLIKPSFGYRVDYDGPVIIYSIAKRWLDQITMLNGKSSNYNTIFFVNHTILVELMS